MNFFEALEWNNWKNLSSEAKVQVISQVYMYFVSPLKQISQVECCCFEIDGVKCETFECLIDGEAFVFVPGNRESILGWDLGIEGLPAHILENKVSNATTYYQQFAHSYEFQSAEDWDIFVDESTSPLRKVCVEPMLVQKKAQPVGTTFIGYYFIETGEFQGDLPAYTLLQASFLKGFTQPTSFAESLNWELPSQLFEENTFFAILDESQLYYTIYAHRSMSLRTLKATLDQQMFDLLDENQWEFACGGGTRKLFRWGNAIFPRTPFDWQTTSLLPTENQFGLVIAQKSRVYEVTRSTRLKLEVFEQTGQVLFDWLPLSTYYRSRKLITEDDVLDPNKYTFRKAIIIQQTSQ